MKKRYSEVYKTTDGKEMRYNYTDKILEYVYEEDGEILVVDAIGLSEENWEDDKEHWLDMYSYEIDQEIQFLWDPDEFI